MDLVRGAGPRSACSRAAATRACPSTTCSSTPTTLARPWTTSTSSASCTATSSRENLILGERGVILVDFGVARELLDETGGTSARSASARRASWRPRSSPAARCPSAATSSALAITMSTLLCGQLPRYGDTTVAARPRPRTSRQELAEALRAGMEFMPERRIASIDAFATAIGRPLREREGFSLVRSVHEPEGAPSLIDAGRAHGGRRLRRGRGVDRARRRGDAGARLQGGLGRGRGGHRRRAAGAGQGLGRSSWPRTARRSSSPTAATTRASPPRIAENTGYVPIHDARRPAQARRRRRSASLSLLDRRDGGAYGGDDVTRATLFADLATEVILIGPEALGVT